MTIVTIPLFPFLLLIAIAAAVCFRCCDANSNVNVVCIESEREALLKLKNDLTDPSNRLSSWVEGGDCCEWNGVVCHNLTGHVNQLHLAAPPFSAFDEWRLLGGRVNPSLLQLKHLNSLDLSNNNFSSIQIPDFFGLLGSLTYLNLSLAQFQGAIPHNLGNLPKLHYLDLRGWDPRDMEAKSLEWVSGLSSLQYLDLSGVDLHEATDWLQVTFNLPCLLELHLSYCNLKGPIPDYLGNKSFLEVVDLSSNSLNSSIPNSLYSLNHLQFLSLGYNHFEGEISSALGNLSSLIHLDLSVNSLEGRLPTSLEHLCNLKELDLSSNQIDGDISEILQSLSSCSLDCLESLNMENNQLSGHLTDQLGQFKNLVHLSLAGNTISGQIPLSIGELSSLEVFDVSENQLNGTFPPTLGQLGNLETLNIGQNVLEGVVSETYFSNLTRLTQLMASGNMLTFQPNPSWVPPFQCETIELGQWHLGPKFPRWLRFQRNLSDLNISHAGISDVLPTWFLNLSTHFEYVDLSSNDLTGGISYLNVTTFLDLSSNRFTGPLPRLLPTLLGLVLSNNSFSGSLVEFVCNSSESRNMWILDISTNLLFGEIPDCWSHWQGLGILNLGNNKLTGKIPSSLGYTNPVELNLRNNSMFGEIPSTLQNCSRLLILDLSENHFSGSVPAWMGEKLSSLVVLRLRSNKFDGHIPHKICALQYLQNLDLAHNNISGAIPKCFSNFSAMATKNKTFYYLRGWFFDGKSFQPSALLELKGREDEYSSTLGLVTSLDLSANHLTGQIPKELGTLTGLRSLNLSRNLLTGNIPDNIGNMEPMESLDLSMNKLHGGIPSSFSNLNFLNHFNVSYNNLTGQIPTSTQLQSFENSSYMPNHLRGPPVSKNCITKGVPTDGGGSEESNGRSKVKGLYVSIVVGFVMGFWGVVAPLFFIRVWRHAYFQKLDHVGRKLYVFWATMGR
ncbi:hypothetical protein like AT2G34930 [Hibiscus trionum]|uniref:Leucine-rich repeat-containing N-terminal plant-type domain-containing protein n=1 Tax=Hibiscus trionum TaxID=183268 RepID=A0A9W7HKQ0_HIBTR|nr:hypothetical protein like AT2G34930 [Hibiscus trionum]